MPAAAGDRQDDGLHHPRPARGAPARRPDRDHARRRDRAARDAGGARRLARGRVRRELRPRHPAQPRADAALDHARARARASRSTARGSTWRRPCATPCRCSPRARGRSRRRDGESRRRRRPRTRCCRRSPARRRRLTVGRDRLATDRHRRAGRRRTARGGAGASSRSRSSSRVMVLVYRGLADDYPWPTTLVWNALSRAPRRLPDLAPRPAPADDPSVVFTRLRRLRHVRRRPRRLVRRRAPLAHVARDDRRGRHARRAALRRAPRAP